MSRQSLYNRTMKISRLKLSGQDAVGGTTQVVTQVNEAPCRIRQLRAEEMSVGGDDGVVSTHRIYCVLSDIRNKDTIEINKILYDVNTINPTSANDGTMQIDITLRN